MNAHILEDDLCNTAGVIDISGQVGALLTSLDEQSRIARRKVGY